jgi:NAD(P)-dependent dehydrogenase (short-subunit alcohol dehydrogenase family)
MDSFSGKLAVVTGGGSGMGRELVRQLAAQGCSVAACDLNADAVAETAALAREGAPPGIQVSDHACDVAEEAQVLRFRDELLAAHATDHVDLVFSNAGIGGGGSFVNDRREDWERTFAVDWWGVYYCARAFLPLLIAHDHPGRGAIGGLADPGRPGRRGPRRLRAREAGRRLRLRHAGQPGGAERRRRGVEPGPFGLIRGEMT